MPEPEGHDREIRQVLGLDTKRGSRRWLKILVLLLVLAAVAALVWRGVVRHRAALAQPKFRTEQVQKQDIRVTVSTTGKLRGLNTVEVGAEVTGRVLRILVDYNDPVKRGQLLAEIDAQQLLSAAEESRAQVLSAEANIKTAEATRVETRQAQARAEELAKQGLASGKELEAARAAAIRGEAALTAANASAALARAALNSAQSRLAKTKIYSPIDGVVLARLIEPGQTVTAGFQTPLLFKLAEDLAKLALYVDIDESDIGRVREQMEATFTVDAYPLRKFTSKVLSLRNEPKLTQTVVTYEAVLSVDNADRALRPGMTATATIVSELLQSKLAVPNAALRFTPPELNDDRKDKGVSTLAVDQKRVYVTKDATVEPIPVKVGSSDGHVTELLEGALNVGSEVVVDVIEER